MQRRSFLSLFGLVPLVKLNAVKLYDKIRHPFGHKDKKGYATYDYLDQYKPHSGVVNLHYGVEAPEHGPMDLVAIKARIKAETDKATRRRSLEHEDFLRGWEPPTKEALLAQGWTDSKILDEVIEYWNSPAGMANPGAIPGSRF